MILDKASSYGYGTQYGIVYRPDAQSPWSVLDRGQVKEIKTQFTPNYQNITNGYPYTNRCHVKIELSNGNYLDFDTQDISNQPTWAGGTIASLNQAAADISNW